MQAYLQSFTLIQLFTLITGRGSRCKRLAVCLGSGGRALALGIFAAAALANAQEHLVSPAELRQDLGSVSDGRQSDVRDVREFFASEAVAARLPAGLDAARIFEAVPVLDDGELARLAETTRGIERDLRAGQLTNLQLTYIVIALATAIIVILAT